MQEAQRKFLEGQDVRIEAENSEVHFGFGKLRAIAFEPYVELRAGRFDIRRIGSFTYLGGGTSIFRNVASIGRFCSIAPNVHVGPVEHPTYFLSAHQLLQGRWGHGIVEIDAFKARNSAALQKSRKIYDDRYSDAAAPVTIGNDVWIGDGAFIRRGITIGDGAVIGARTVVTRDVPPYAVVVGMPARITRYRFDADIVEGLLDLAWWRYGLAILDGLPYEDPAQSLKLMRARVGSGAVTPWKPHLAQVLPDGRTEVIE